MLLSGAFRPGLIEAGRRQRARRRPEQLSGAFRPGLIEARGERLLVATRIRGYPGHFAPASLKRKLPIPSCISPRRLSGAFRPGLIEALGKPGSYRSEVPLSGAFRPGLIEAFSSMFLSGHPRAVLSGAFRPGLIEARRYRTAAGSPSRQVIRGISPRPH